MQNQKPIGIFDLDDNLIEVYPTLYDLCKDKPFNKTNVVAVCRGRKKTCYGYKFKYMEEGDSDGNCKENIEREHNAVC